MLEGYNYDDHRDSPIELARKVIETMEQDGTLSFPIDPFDLLKSSGIVYQFRDFDRLEGVYVCPENNQEVPIVGINKNRPLTRQRFTAAHELCHHIKDRKSVACPITGELNEIEVYANNFASELLMPRGYFEKFVEEHRVDGYVSFDSALQISLQFGVSFQSCVLTLAYRCGVIEGNIESKELKKRIKKFSPMNQIRNLNLLSFDDVLQGQILNSYTYFFEQDSSIVWNKFKKDNISNETRIEGSVLPIETIAEIITDLRLHKQDSEYCKSDLKDVIETAGQVALYDFVFSTNQKVTVNNILLLHKMLYQYAPFPEYGGHYRVSNNIVLKAIFETTDASQIEDEMNLLEKKIEFLYQNFSKLSVSDFIDSALEVHHYFTVIHPFDDGNGRISRMILNWIFKLKHLPPVYLKYAQKNNYYEALEEIDKNGDYKKLKSVFFLEIINTMIQLHDDVLY